MRTPVVSVLVLASFVLGAISASEFVVPEHTAERATVDRGEEPTQILSRLASIEAHLDRLTREVGALRAGPRRPARDPAGAALEDADIARAIAHLEVERRRQQLDALTDAQLLAEAQRLLKSDPVEARRVLRVALERSLEQEPLTRAMTQLGLLARAAGDPDEAERVLHNASIAGAVTDTGTWASYELAMTVSDRGDHERALAIAEPVPQTPGISEWNRLHALWTIATIEERSGDVDSAKAAYRSIIDSCKGPDEYAWMLDKANARLAAL